MFGHHTGKWFRALSDEMPQNSLLLLLLKAMEKNKRTRLQDLEWLFLLLFQLEFQIFVIL